MQVIGVDVGSTSVKAVRLDAADDRVSGVATQPLRAQLPTPPGRHEEDPLAVARAVEEVLAELGTPSVEAICFTGQMHGGLLVAPDGTPLTAMITWQDRRAEPQAAALRAAGRWPGLGTDVYGGFLGATVRWMRDEQALPPPPWMLAGVYEWTAARVLGVGPYTDPGSAAAWGLYDIEAAGWHAGAMEGCGIPAASLPRVVESGHVVGTVGIEPARRLGISPQTRVISGVGDTQASYLGSGCQPDEALLNVGTGSQLLWENPVFERPPGTDVRLLCGGRFLIGIPTLAGGAAYARLADFVRDVVGAFGHELARDDVYRVLNARAGEAAPGACGVRVSPLFLGSRCKGVDLRASIGGLDGANFTLSNVSRAVLEGMVDEIAEAYFTLAPALRRHRGLVGAGNAMRLNPLLCEVAAERFGLPLRMSPCEEEAALGAARLAGCE